MCRGFCEYLANTLFKFILEVINGVAEENGEKKTNKGCFNIRRNKDSSDMDFGVRDEFGENQIPNEQKKLRIDIEHTLIVLRGLFLKQDRDSFDKYFEQLYSLTEAGLVMPNATPKMASERLASLKKDVLIQEGGKVKNKYIKALGRSVSVFILAFMSFILFFYSTLQNRMEYITYLTWVNFFIMLIGTVIGVWLSFGIRKIDLKFEELHIIEEDRFEPTMRILFVSLLAVIVGLFFSTGVVVIKLGAISTDMINYDSQVAFLIGLLLGLVEKVLAEKVTEQANKFIN